MDVITIYRRRGFDRPRHERTRFDSGQSKPTRLESAVERWKAIRRLKLGSVGTDPEPDSWEKLDEDLHAVEVCGDSPDLEDPVCAYAHNIGKKCAECKLYAGDCTVNMCEDIASRINKLRSESK